MCSLRWYEQRGFTILVRWGVNIIVAFDLLDSPPSTRYYIPLPSTSRHDRVALRAFFFFIDCWDQ